MFRYSQYGPARVFCEWTTDRSTMYSRCWNFFLNCEIFAFYLYCCSTIRAFMFFLEETLYETCLQAAIYWQTQHLLHFYVVNIISIKCIYKKNQWFDYAYHGKCVQNSSTNSSNGIKTNQNTNELTTAWFFLVDVFLGQHFFPFIFFHAHRSASKCCGVVVYDLIDLHFLHSTTYYYYVYQTHTHTLSV